LASSFDARFFVAHHAACDEGMPYRALQSSCTPAAALRTIGAE
jgi:hypothetical protein